MSATQGIHGNCEINHRRTQLESMSCFWKLHIGGNINGLATLAIPLGGRVHSHMMRCMVWWRAQKDGEDQKELAEWTGIGMTRYVREDENRRGVGG